MTSLPARRLQPLFAVLLMLLPTACDQSSPPAKPAVSAHAPAAAAPAAALPRIDLPGFDSLIAQTARDKQILVIDFWATWCPPCVELFPELHDQVGKLGPRVRLVSVTLDSPGAGETAAVAFLEKNHAQHDAYLLVPDTDAQIQIVKHLGKKWQDVVVPAVLVYDTQGKLDGEYIDAAAHADLVAAGVRKLLGEPAGTQP